jgi:hypothetical protein
LDKLFIVAITFTQKLRLPDDATWLVCRLLVLSWADFFCSQLCSSLFCVLNSDHSWSVITNSRTAQKTPALRVPFHVFYPPVASVYSLQREHTYFWIFTCVVTSVMYALSRKRV